MDSNTSKKRKVREKIEIEDISDFSDTYVVPRKRKRRKKSTQCAPNMFSKNGSPHSSKPSHEPSSNVNIPSISSESRNIPSISNQSRSDIPKGSKQSDTLTRCEVISIVRKVPTELSCKCKVLEQEEIQIILLVLRNEWSRTMIRPNDTLNIIGSIENGKCVVDRNHGFVVLHPHQLLGSSRIGESIKCLRRSYFSSKFSTKVDTQSKVALIGTILHEIFQRCLKNDFSLENLLKYSEEIVSKFQVQVYLLGESKVSILNEVETFFNQFVAWSNQYFNGFNAARGGKVKGNGEAKSRSIKISKIVDIEECIWSLRYGLKGYIDVTCEIENIHTREKEILPLELKSAGNYQNLRSDHLAQLSLYILMMGDKYGNSDLKEGMMYYMRNNQMIAYGIHRQDFAHLLQRRNDVAASLVKSSPPPIQVTENCKYCYQKHACFVFQKVKNPQKKPNIQDYDDITSHLTQEDIQWMDHWLNLVEIEGNEEMQNINAFLQYRNTNTREMKGTCISDLQLDEHTFVDGVWTWTFVRRNDKPFNIENFLDGTSVLISSEEASLYGVMQGTIEKIFRKHIVVTSHRELIVPPIYDRSSMVFCLDKSAYVARGSNGSRYNIMRLFFPPSDPISPVDKNCQRLKRILIQKKQPKFNNTSLSVEETDGLHLNDDQLASIQLCLQAEDYALIHGMPGTGKTTLIASLISILTNRKKKVLITSLTHTALDNLLLKLKMLGTSFLRFTGNNHEAVENSLREHIPIHDSQESIVESLQNYYAVGCTVARACMTDLLNEFEFDYCIVDEATQISTPVILGALMRAKKFILVGDHLQLGPIVRNSAAKLQGLDHSLFYELIGGTHGKYACQKLTIQYRMNEGILGLANYLVYNNELKCANDKLKKSTIPVSSLHSQPEWLQDVMNPRFSIVFLNTDYCPGAEEDSVQVESQHPQIWNSFEVDIVKDVTEALVNCVDPQNIGIITPYNQQVFEIRKVVSENVYVHTIDRFQGIDKQVILISLVRNNQQNQISEIMKDLRRLNVAITRAKVKLIFIGSISTVQTHRPYDRVMKFLETDSHSSIVQLHHWNSPNSSEEKCIQSPIKKTMNARRMIVSKQFVLSLREGNVV